MTLTLLVEQNLEFVSLKGGCIGSSESTHVKMLHCWKSHVTAHLSSLTYPKTRMPKQASAMQTMLL